MVKGNIKALLLAVLALSFTACTSSTGWGVGFNVYPVTQMRNVHSLQGNQTTDIRRGAANGNEKDY